MKKNIKQHILITAATEMELAKAKKHFANKTNIHFAVTGVGMLVTCFNLCKLIYETKATLIFQIGIAGGFDINQKLSNVYVVKKDFLGDVGVMENNVWKDVFDLNLIDKNTKPFTANGLNNLYVNKINVLNLPLANACTVNQISTNENIAHQIQKKYKIHLESMEGAALHYVCNSFKIPYLQLRATSNYIGERNKTNWKIKGAISNINNALINTIEKL